MVEMLVNIIAENTGVKLTAGHIRLIRQLTQIIPIQIIRQIRSGQRRGQLYDHTHRIHQVRSTTVSSRQVNSSQRDRHQISAGVRLGGNTFL